MTFDLSQTWIILSRTTSTKREPSHRETPDTRHPLALLAGLGLAPPALAQVTVAVAGPQSGPLASFGAMMAEGAARAAQAVNARGGK